MAIITIYSMAHICARLLASPNLGEDDPLINLYTQQAALGYGLDEPPLYTWIMYVVQQLTGPYLISFQLVKYAFVIATTGALFWCAYAVTGHAVWSLVTAEALTLIYHVGWRFHEGFAGLIPAMLCSVLALLFVLRIIERQRTIDFIGLGVACGLGLLSQYSFVIGIGSFALAALPVKAVRIRLYCVKLFLAIGICLILMMPHIMWIIDAPARLNHFLSVYSAFTHPSPRIDVWRVVKKTLAAPFVFYWSLLLILLIAASERAVRQSQFRHLLPKFDWRGQPLLQFLGWYAIAAHCILFASGIAVSHVTYAYHDLLSIMLPTLVLLFALILQSQPDAEDIRRWAMISAGVLVFAFIARAANMFVMEPFCKLCRWGIPYEQLAEELKSSGFEKGLIVGLEQDLAGNMRMYFPTSEIFSLGLKGLRPVWRQTRSGKPYVIVWQIGGKHGLHDSREVIRQHLDAAGFKQQIQVFNAPWRHILRPDGYRQTEWNYVISSGLAGK